MKRKVDFIEAFKEKNIPNFFLFLEETQKNMVLVY